MPARRTFLRRFVRRQPRSRSPSERNLTGRRCCAIWWQRWSGGMKIFVVDVGNSNSVFGLFEWTRLRWQRRCETAKTVSLVKKIGLKRVDGVAVASVVPSLDRTLKQILKKKFGVAPLFVSSKIRLPIKLKVRKPSQVGADRIANVVGAWGLFRKACIVVDFGTATTFDVISEKGEYLG